MKRRIALILALIAASLGLFVLWIEGALEAPEARISAALGAAIDHDAIDHNATTAPPGLAVPSNDGAPAPEERQSAAAPPADFAAALTAAVGSAPETHDATLIVRCLTHGSGAPLAGTRVRLVPKERSGLSFCRIEPGTRGTLHDSPLTAAEGEVEFELPSGLECSLYADPKSPDAGHVMKNVPALQPGERRTLVLEIRAGDDLHVFGVVLAREGRAPIAGAKVLALSEFGSGAALGGDGRSKVRPLAEAITRGDGRFELTTASRKHPILRVQAEGFSPSFASLPVDQAGQEEERVLTLERGATIEATVIDARGSPPSDVVVRASADGFDLKEKSGVLMYDAGFSSKVKWEATTAAGGSCTLKDVAARVSLTIEIEDKGKVLQKLSLPVLEPGEVRAIEIRIGGGCAVSGVVLDEKGAPVAGQFVWLTRESSERPRYLQRFEEQRLDAKAMTDQVGRFTFADVAGGRCLIGPAPAIGSQVEPKPDAAAPYAEIVDVPSDAPQMSIVIQAQRGLFIRGQVLGSNGMPAEQAMLSAFSESTRSSLPAVVGREGSFVVGPLMPGAFRLTARGMDMDSSSETVTANAGDEHVVLKLQAGGTIEGKVVDGASGQGVRADIRCTATIQGKAGPGFAVVMEDGSFEFKSMLPGAYDLTARVADGRVGILRGVQVAAGARTKDVVLRLEPGAKLRVRYESATAQGYVSVYQDGIRVGSDDVRAKAMSLQVVPPGKLTIELRPIGSGKKQVREITIHAGEEKEVVFDDGG